MASSFDVNQILQQVERLPAPARIGIVVGVFAAVIGLYWFAMYGAELNKLQGYRNELTKLQDEIAEARAVASNLKTFEEEREELRKELQAALRRLPNDSELPGLLTDISSLGKKSGLEIRAFDPLQKVERGFYAEVPIKLEFYGSYHELGVFFDRLSRLSRIVNISEVKMTLESDTGQSPKLQIKGVATTFQFLRDSTEVATGE